MPKAARLAGFMLVALACLFVGQRIFETRLWEAAAAGRLLPAVAAGAVAYGMAGLLLCAAWHRILTWCTGTRLPARPHWGIYARTQIGKYLPGNVFHLLGRHVTTRGLGVGDKPMLWAAAAEAVGLILAASLIAGIGAAWYAGGLAATPGANLAPWLVATGVALLGGAYAGSRMRAARRWLGWTAGRPLAGLVPAGLLHVAFFLASGGIMWALLTTAGAAVPVTAVATAVAAAWISGFLVPGAAAGVGVREAVLIAALTPLAGEAPATLVAVAYRAVTVGGDATLFAIGLLPALRKAG